MLNHELKFYLLSNGASVTLEAKTAWSDLFHGPLTLNEYASTSGICLYTEDDIYMNVPFIENFTKQSRAIFTHDGSNFLIIYRDNTVRVLPIAVPAYHTMTYRDNDEEIPFTNIGVTHTDRCRISPIEGCAWQCKFCDMAHDFKYRKKPKEKLLEVVQIAEKDILSPARHVLISGGTPKVSDELWMDEIYAYIATYSPISVDIMMSVRPEKSYLRWLKSIGINLISVNLEVYDKDRARIIVPNKAKKFGLDFYLSYIDEAVRVFGVGFVQSLLVFGNSIEPIESTLKGVKELADRGCMPVLSPFRPDPTTPLGNMPPASFEEMKQVCGESIRICEESRTGVKLGPRCIPCQHNTVTFPDNTDFYIPLGESLTKPPTL